MTISDAIIFLQELPEFLVLQTNSDLNPNNAIKERLFSIINILSENDKLLEEFNQIKSQKKASKWLKTKLHQHEAFIRLCRIVQLNEYKTSLESAKIAGNLVNCLFILGNADRSLYSLPVPMDMIWHYSILDTDYYPSLCAYSLKIDHHVGISHDPLGSTVGNMKERRRLFLTSFDNEFPGVSAGDSMFSLDE